MLDLNAYLVKEHVGLMKLADVYDIFDAQTGKQVGVAKEEPSGFMTFLRLLIHKRMLPTTVSIYAHEYGPAVFRIRRGLVLLRSKVDILDGDGHLVGYFKSKLFSLGGGFYVYDQSNQQFAEVRGDWKGWNFKFLTSDGRELGTVTKKWAGMAKELFTSADNYVITLDDEIAGSRTGNMLLLAAGLAIDIIYKER